MDARRCCGRVPNCSELCKKLNGSLFDDCDFGIDMPFQVIARHGIFMKKAIFLRSAFTATNPDRPRTSNASKKAPEPKLCNRELPCRPKAVPAFSDKPFSFANR
jgi:hypothetical protein